MGFVLLSIALVPLFQQFNAIQRTSVSARRLFELTARAEMILEAIGQLEADELPDFPDTGETLLLMDGGACLSGSARWQEIRTHFEKTRFENCTRKVVATRLKSGPVLVRMDIEYRRIFHDPKTLETMVLSTLTRPRCW